MEIRYLKSVTITAVDEDGETVVGKLDLLSRNPEIEFDSFWPHRLFLMGIEPDGLRLRYHNVSPYGADVASHLFVKADEPFTFVDEKTNCPITILAEYVTAEVGELTLKVEESAKDSSGQYYRNGDSSKSVPALKGTTFQTELLRDNVPVKIVDVDLSSASVWVSVGNEDFLINPFQFIHQSESGGCNSRYDYESWERYYHIYLDLPFPHLRMPAKPR